MKSVKLGKLCNFLNGGTPNTKVPEYYEGDVPWITSADITEDGAVLAPRSRITETAIEESSTNLVPADTVLFVSRTGVGKVAKAPYELCFSQDITALTPQSSDLETDYLIRFLRTKKSHFTRFQRGATIKGVSRDVLSEIDVPLPPLAEQKRIAAILDKADALRQKRKESLKLLDEFIRSVFLEMFGDPIGNPMGWNKMKLGELCLIRRGASPRPIKNFVGGTVPWIKIGDATKGGDIYIEKTAEAITEEGAKRSVLLEEGSLVFANCGVSLGFARILKLRGCIHDGWLSLEKIDERLDKLYLLKLINGMTKYLREAAPDGTQPNLNTMIMKGFEIPVPPKDMQKRFSEIVHRWQGTKSKLMRSSEQLDNQFNSLVQRAFRGEL